MNTGKDSRIVLTLDAGGTNFEFSAIQGNVEVVPPIKTPSFSDNLDKCISNIIKGFENVKDNLSGDVEAISFAFPGPADYKKGIIGNLPNFEAFKGGVPLGPILENHFDIPVFINNDGNLFAYGEALAGYLPYINNKLQEQGSGKRFGNLIGLTLGTGFGSGIVINEKLLNGDNSCGAEVHNTLNAFHPEWNAEEGVSTRAIQRVYAEESNLAFSSSLMPFDIYEIAKGRKEGNTISAAKAFNQYGRNLGNSITNIVSLIDGIVVLGGGITAASDLFFPSMFAEINRKYKDFKGRENNRLSYKVFDLTDASVFKDFATGKTELLNIPGSSRKIEYDSMPRTGVGISALGASKAVALGAYAFALSMLD